MIANIIPLRRLPRSLEAFSYQVPETFRETLTVGQLVSIPFRNSQEFGIVLSMDKTMGGEKLKYVETIVHSEPIVAESYLQFCKKISLLYGISLSAILQMAFPDIGTRTAKKISLLPLPQKKDLSSLPIYNKYNSPEEHKNFLISAVQGQTIFFVPEKQYLQSLFDLLPFELQEQTVLWHGDLKTKEKREIWFQIRNNEKKIIVGTRSAAFLPLCHVETIVVDYEHHIEHKNGDQAPRFSLKDITPLIAQAVGAQEIHMSYSPSVSSYFFLHKNGYSNSKKEQLLDFSSLVKNGKIEIVDMNNEKKAGNSSPVCEKIEHLIQDSLHDIFLLINRKGSATGVICPDCKYEEKCSQCGLFLMYHEREKFLKCHYCNAQKYLPPVCPKCRSASWKFTGTGTESIEKRIREISPKQKQIIRIDSEESGTVPEETKTPKIIIGTEKAIESVKWEKTHTVAVIDFDRQIIYPEYKTSEHVWQLLTEIQYCRQPGTEFLIQTRDPKHLILRSLSEPDRFYRTELNTRQKLGYPPYTFLIRYVHCALNAQAGWDEATKVAKTIETVLTKGQKKGTVTGPIELHPKYFKGKFWYGIIVKLEYKNWQQDVIDINMIIPAHWKIDPNPENLLQP